MAQTWLLIVTAVVEIGTGLSLLCLPSVPLALLLGVSPAAAETAFVARIAGAAIVAIGVASWSARNDRPGPAQRGVLVGVLVYDAAAAALLAYAGAGMDMAGLSIWPAGVLHTALAGWCVACLLVGPHGDRAATRGDSSSRRLEHQP